MDYREPATRLEPDRSLLVVAILGSVYAIERDTGSFRWQFSLPGGAVPVAIAIGYGVVIASNDDTLIYCLDYLTGELRREQTMKLRGRATILIEPDHIVCAKTGLIDSFAPDGKRLWTRELLGAGVATIGYPGNVVQADER
jgi:hypothetical protein